MRKTTTALVALLLALPARQSPAAPSLSGKLWDPSGRPVATPPSTQLSSVSPSSWPAPPGMKEYTTAAMVVEFGSREEEFSFLMYPGFAQGEYWVAQLKSAGREVRGKTAAREGYPFAAPPGLVGRFAAGPSAEDWESVVYACALGSAPKIAFLRSLPKTHTIHEVTVSPKANPADPSSPSSFPSRELHLIKLSTGEMFEGVIPIPSPRWRS